MKHSKPTPFSLSLVLICALVVALAGVLALNALTHGKVDQANRRRETLLGLSDELRQSSNILGRMATGYVLSGDPSFKRHYQDIVAIVEGRRPRPNEGRVYWDQFVLADNTAPPEGTRTIALMSMLGAVDVTPAESAKLLDAKRHSDALNSREVAAMALVDSTFDWRAEQAPALAMLTGADYRADRAAAMKPIEQFRMMVDERTRADVQLAEREFLGARTAVIVISILLVAILLRTYGILWRVMGGSVDLVHARIAALGRGDFSQEIVVDAKRRDSVMGRLADTQAKLAASHRESERVTRRLEESELNFRQLAENIGAVFFLADVRCAEFSYVSAGYEALWGRTCESLYADPGSWHEAIHADDRRKVQDAIGAESAAGGFEYECRIVRPDNSLRWIRVLAFPVDAADMGSERVAGFAIDTTHRTKLGVVAHDSGKRFGQVVDHIDVPCFIANREGRITYCNDAALALTGWSRPELLGRASSEILAPFAMGPGVEASNDPGTWRTENRVTARDGSLRAGTWRHIRLVSAEGLAEGTAMVAESVS